MIDKRPISSLYSLALIEGEGVGTAYEYYVKRLMLSSWLNVNSGPGHMLVAGLPEKYGSSLDFVLLASDLGLKLLVIDERPKALEMLASSIEFAQDKGWFPGLEWRVSLTELLSFLNDPAEVFELALSSEVVQRIRKEDRRIYLDQIVSCASRVALFVPNKNNASHRSTSGLAGISTEDLSNLFHDRSVHVGYVDMPPFPPGITRTKAQRERAKEGFLERTAMSALQHYARLEHLLPIAIRMRYSHIVYALT